MSVSSSPIMKPFIPPSTLKGLFVGSGSDGLNEPEIAKSILNLATTNGENDSTTDNRKQLHVLYLGTATYDLTGPATRQTQRFIEMGCSVQSLKLVSEVPSKAEMAAAVDAADIIVVSGGNTLYAVDRWTRLGLHTMLQQAMMRGTVLTGGSAGAICWFQGGHSDSMDPDTYKTAMLAAADTGGDESSPAPVDGDSTKPWEYIRVDGLGFLPGLVCPHHDKVQSNGVLRAEDFNAMLLRHSTELGIGIDHWAALEVHGDEYRVISLEGKEGSVLGQTFSPDRKGVPGIWLKQVLDGKVQTTLCPSKGRLQELLKIPSRIIKDDRVDICRRENPDDGPVA